jgi:hypothetical protein
MSNNSTAGVPRTIDPEMEPLSYVGFVLYVTMGILLVLRLAKTRREDQFHPIRKFHRVFYITALLLALIRAAWAILLNIDAEHTYTYTLNRFAFAILYVFLLSCHSPRRMMSSCFHSLSFFSVCSLSSMPLFLPASFAV